MPKRSSTKKPEEEVEQEMPAEPSAAAEEPAPAAEKNPAAVALGRLGGKKGGPARAKKLTKAERSAIAKKAAAARWKKTD